MFNVLRKPWFLIHLGCFVAFIIQMTFLTKNQVQPSQTVINTEKKDLKDLEFPIVFKICIIPGFDFRELENVGYGGPVPAYNYFVGKSRYNGSVYGWAGHTSDGRVVSNISGKGSFLSKVLPHLSYI